MKIATRLMLRCLAAATVVTLSLGASAKPSDAQDFNKWISNTKGKLKMSPGPLDEGRKDNRNGVGTGSVVDWNTYPGDIYVQPASDDEKYKGTIAFHFSGRERKADYKVGQQTGTNDTQTNGKVTAFYEFTFDGNVLIKDVKKEGGLGRVGDKVVGHVTSLNGVKVKD